MWTPYKMEIILHHHCSEAPFARASAPAYWPTVKELVDDGILWRGGIDLPLKTTDLGKGLIEMWANTPIPVVKYVDPRFGEAVFKQRERA